MTDNMKHEKKLSAPLIACTALLLAAIVGLTVCMGLSLNQKRQAAPEEGAYENVNRENITF